MKSAMPRCWHRRRNELLALENVSRRFLDEGMLRSPCPQIGSMSGRDCSLFVIGGEWQDERRQLGPTHDDLDLAQLPVMASADRVLDRPERVRPCEIRFPACRVIRPQIISG